MKILLIDYAAVRLEIKERDCELAIAALKLYLETHRKILTEKAVESISSMIDTFVDIEKERGDSD